MIRQQFESAHTLLGNWRKAMAKMCPIGFLNRGSNVECCGKNCEWWDEYFECCVVRSYGFPLRFEDETKPKESDTEN